MALERASWRCLLFLDGEQMAKRGKVALASGNLFRGDEGIKAQEPEHSTNSNPLAWSRVSKTWSFCGMSPIRVLNLQQEIKDLLVFGQSLLRCQAQRSLDQRHVDSGVVRRPPGKAGVRGHRVCPIHLRQCCRVNHGVEDKSLGFGRREHA